MKTNIGYIDRSIRLIVACVIVLVYGTQPVTPPLDIIILVFAGVLFLTGFIGVCPLYSVFRVSTRRIK